MTGKKTTTKKAAPVPRARAPRPVTGLRKSEFTVRKQDMVAKILVRLDADAKAMLDDLKTLSISSGPALLAGLHMFYATKREDIIKEQREAL